MLDTLDKESMMVRLKMLGDWPVMNEMCLGWVLSTKDYGVDAEEVYGVNILGFVEEEILTSER